ncbi:hypothetical protein [Bacteroides ovatus]|uniref:hypothetical protein n=1 Tax=Bacteroides ovatus TaxID=28116 RepID=UPI00234D2118|nr:hypothetical protein [Bacteroides ovatus]MDC7147552.1 hypothetical protein [Bacteroides ovatus]
MKTGNKEQVSPEEMVLIEYLMAFLPAERNSENAILKTSQNIQDDLSDMCEISINQITSVMRDTGYHIIVDEDNRPKWVMARQTR